MSSLPAASAAAAASASLQPLLQSDLAVAIPVRAAAHSEQAGKGSDKQHRAHTLTTAALCDSAPLPQLSSFFDHFTCAICLGELSRAALLRSCSHQFCHGCISECLNRKHVCPLCQCAATVDSLVLNPSMDHTLAAIKAAQRKEKDRRMKQIMSKANGAAAAAANDDQLAPPSLPLISRDSSSSSSALSPIESVFRSHASAKLLLPFEQAYQQLVSEAKEAAAAAAGIGGSAMSDGAAASSSAAAAASAPGGPAEPSSATEQQSQSAFYARAMPALIGSYAEYLQSLPPPLCLEPIYCSVTVQSAAPPQIGASAAAPSPLLASVGPSVQFRVTLWPWEDVTQLARKIVAESTKPEQPAAAAIRLCPITADRVAITMTSMGQGGKQAAAQQAGSDSSSSVAASASAPRSSAMRLPLQLNDSSADLTRTFGSIGLLGSCELIVKGAVEFASASDLKPLCFMRVFDAALDQRVDYFKCAECALNWLCAACASSCHAGHTISAFMIGHKPSYAACYCNKKKGCTLRSK